MGFQYGLDLVDNHSIRGAILSMAPLFPRHYVMMEVKQNLTSADRKQNLKRFDLPHFKNIATVVMGEPAAEYKEKVYGKLLVEKQKKSDVAWKQAKQEKEKKKAIKKKQKEIADRKKAFEENMKKKKAEAEAKKAEDAAKKKEAEEAWAKKKEEEEKKKGEGGEKQASE